jgi:hypothetical protein
MAFRQVRDKLWFNWAVTGRALRHIQHDNILDRFWDFDDYLGGQQVAIFD